MSRIYTRTGDSGETGLFGGVRVPKNHPRVGAYGTVDELNSVLGWALTQTVSEPVRERLGALQHDLFTLGAELATPQASDGRIRPPTPGVPATRIREMEAWIDEAEGALPPLKNFVIPGGAAGAAALHVARTVCRRAEREVARIAAEEGIDPVVLTYLNRLSDLLFTFARLENRHAGGADVAWRKHEGSPPLVPETDPSEEDRSPPKGDADLRGAQ